MSVSIFKNTLYRNESNYEEENERRLVIKKKF